MIIDGYTRELQEQLIQRRTLLIEEENKNHKKSKTLQRPLACRNTHCGAMCSPVDADFCNCNPSKCFNYERRDDLYKNNEILGKIREEIKQNYCVVNNDYDHGRNYGLYIATQILDKYKAESEDKE